MLRAIICSDLHLEFYDNDKCPFLKKLLKPPSDNVKPDNVKCDTLIIAGDFGYPFNKKNAVNQIFVSVLTKLKLRFEHIVYVSGNHEYYQTLERNRSIEETDKSIRDICDKIGIHFLQKDSWIHPSGVRFIGCTLWSDIGPEACKDMNDFQKVFESKYEYNALHQDHKDWLERQILVSEQTNPIIVVTHHLPSFKGIAPHYKDATNNSAYASNLDYLFDGPVIGWAGGHVHYPQSVQINGRFLHINPIGYKGEKIQHPRQDDPFVFIFDKFKAKQIKEQRNDLNYSLIDNLNNEQNNNPVSGLSLEQVEPASTSVASFDV